MRVRESADQEGEQHVRRLREKREVVLTQERGQLERSGVMEGESGERSKGSIMKSFPLCAKGYQLESERSGYH